MRKKVVKGGGETEVTEGGGDEEGRKKRWEVKGGEVMEGLDTGRGDIKREGTGWLVYLLHTG